MLTAHRAWSTVFAELIAVDKEVCRWSQRLLKLAAPAMVQENRSAPFATEWVSGNVLTAGEPGASCVTAVE